MGKCRFPAVARESWGGERHGKKQGQKGQLQAAVEGGCPRRWHHGHVQLCEVHSSQELTVFTSLYRDASCFPFGTFPINRLLEEWLLQLPTVVCHVLRQWPHFSGFQNKPKEE